MFDTALLFAQTVATGTAAAWMFTGVRDNILYPAQNETYTAEVMEMRRLEAGYPEAFAPVQHRRVTSRRVQLLAFRAVVLTEAVSCLLLIVGTAALLLALFGVVDPLFARALALFGAAIFTAVWAGMLIVGNYFCYWFGHEGAQLTHYHMNLWGLATMILLCFGGG